MSPTTLESIPEIVLVSGLCADEIDERLRRATRIADVGQRAIAFYLADLHERGLCQMLGRPTTVSYAVHDLGMSRRSARELLRVGLRLRELPKLDEAFADSSMPWSKVRLLCRVATPETEAAWLLRARQTTVDRLELFVRQARVGDPPPADGGFRREPRFTLQVELDVLQQQIFEQARAKLAAELGGDPDLREVDVLMEMARLVLRSNPDGTVPGRVPVDASIYRVVVTEPAAEGELPSVLTEDGPVPIDPRDAAPAQSDGATPPALRARVLARDGQACVCCGSRRGLEVHHIRFRQHGGRTELGNLASLCSACHGLVHHGLLDVDIEKGAGGGSRLVFRNRLGRRLGRRVLHAPRLRFATVEKPAERAGEVAQCATPDGKWLARNLDKFTTVGGRLVLKARHRNAVLAELAAMGLAV